MQENRGGEIKERMNSELNRPKSQQGHLSDEILVEVNS